MKEKLLANKFLSLLLVIGIAISVGGIVTASTGAFNIQNIENFNITSSQGDDEGMLGASTRSDWNVEGNLSVGGTTALSSSVSTGRLTQGGAILATSTTANVGTLTAAQLATSYAIDFTPLMAHATLTLPATSTMTSLLANPGEMMQWVIRNSATAATNTTIAAGAGIDLQEPDGQNVVIGQNNFAWLTCYRKADTDVVCKVNETIPAD